MASATAPLIPDAETVYRGLRNSNWRKAGRVTYKAFLLRPASTQFPAEEELTLGRTPASAVDELQENHGSASLLVSAVHALPHNLSVRIDLAATSKAHLWGLPLFSTDATQRDRAITVATDLAGIANVAPG
jgi:hypothetical protein